MAPLTIIPATDEDAPSIATLRTAAADALTAEYGPGHWSDGATEKGVRRGILSSHLLVARRESAILGTFTLTRTKPWAIDAAYFTPVARPLYLINMAVDPEYQRTGIGRAMMVVAVELARSLGGEAIRLDAYDAPAGAGGFYAKCGMREVGQAGYRGTPLVYFEALLAPVGIETARDLPRSPTAPRPR